MGFHVPLLESRVHDTRPRKLASEPSRRGIGGARAGVRAPAAERPDTADITWRLEDQAFKYLMPQEYKAVSRLVKRKRVEREAHTEESATLLREALRRADIDAVVCGRTKHLYSTYRKLQRYHARGRGFRDICDLTALRVIVDSEADCYLVLGVVHELWRPVLGGFDDYIASPKPNRYQSLHTAVIGPDGDRLEVQIRTKEMHRIAEEGAAAHSSYKHKESDRRRARPGEKPVLREQRLE